MWQKLLGILDQTEHFIFFSKTTETHLKKIILNLDFSKAAQYGDISVKMLKETIDISLVCSTSIINISFEDKSFPNLQKFAKVCPTFKKKKTD